MKRRLYLESTIPSYLVAAPSRDLLIAAHHKLLPNGGEHGGLDSISTFRSSFSMKSPEATQMWPRNRKEIAERFGYDLRAIIADAQKRQKAHGKKVVSFARSKKKRTV